MSNLTSLDACRPEYWQDEQQHLPEVSRVGEPCRRDLGLRLGPKAHVEPVMVRPLDYGRTAVARRVEPLDITIPQQSTMQVIMQTSAVDRAKGFAIETHQLSMVTGAFAVVVAVVGFGHPFLTLGTLWTFFLWYTLVWLVTWIVHRILTPEFVALYNAAWLHRYIDKRS